jgi:hypothetical protein
MFCGEERRLWRARVVEEKELCARHAVVAAAWEDATNPDLSILEMAICEEDLNVFLVVKVMDINHTNALAQQICCKRFSSLDEGRPLVKARTLAHRAGKAGAIKSVLRMMRARALDVQMQISACSALICLSILCRFNNPRFFNAGGLDLVLDSMRVHLSESRLQDLGLTLLVTIARDSDFRYSQDEVKRLTAAVAAVLIGHSTRVTVLETEHDEGWQTLTVQSRTIIGSFFLTKHVFTSDSAAQMGTLGVLPALVNIMFKNKTNREIMDYAWLMLLWLVEKHPANIEHWTGSEHCVEVAAAYTVISLSR